MISETAGICSLFATFVFAMLLPRPQQPQGTSLGHTSAGPFELVPFCSFGVDDVSNPGNCIPANTTPTLGSLYPVSTNMYVDAETGFVGLGITSPTDRLHVFGNARIASDLLFEDDVDGIQFSSDDGNLFAPSTPMISMFEDGTFNVPRMVLSHSTPFELWGLEYRDLSDEFVFRNLSEDVVSIALGGGGLDVNTGSLDVEAGQVTVTNPSSFFATLKLQSTAVPDNTINVLDIESASQAFVGHDLIEARSGFGPVFRVTNAGEVSADGAYTTPAADFAEMIAVGSGAETVEPGDLLVLDVTTARSVVRSYEARSTLVAGIYSTKPGFVGSEQEWDTPDAIDPSKYLSLSIKDMASLYDEIPMAVVGIVPVKASTENGPIRIGDLLVSSSTPGHVMRDPAPAIGTVVGKALAPLESGTRRIKVLVTLQ